jgi:hypothetical protein
MWTALRHEFGLPSLEQVQARLRDFPDPEPLVRSLVRVYIGDGPVPGGTGGESAAQL